MDDSLERYFANVQRINNAVSTALLPIQKQLEDVNIQEDFFDSYVEMIRQTMGPTLHSIQSQFYPQFEEMTQRIVKNSSLIEAIQFYTQESLRLTDNVPELHSTVTEISNTCSAIESGEIAIPQVDSQADSKNFWEFFTDPDWQKEQFCAFVMQLVYNFITQCILGFIPIDTLHQILKEIKEQLIP